MAQSRTQESLNHAYFLCLIDWENKILNPKELDEFAASILGPTATTVDDWKKMPIVWSEFSDIISNAELGFYHSRLIFKFDLLSAPKSIAGIRELRKAIESKIESSCINQIIPAIKKYNKEAKEPHIFVYPIFELCPNADFWKFQGTKPYSLPTTCFYTELDDATRLLRRKKVKMRISGAKIVASNMSEWFFNNLVNIVFHEGLYRQARDKGQLSANKPIYNGLENRLEDFAAKLMTIFHEYSSEYVRRSIQEIALIAAIIGILLTILNFLRPR